MDKKTLDSHLSKGLIIREPYLSQILSIDDPKTWELRTKHTHVRGTIALIRANSQHIIGVANLVDCLDTQTDKQLLATTKKHKLSKDFIRNGEHGKWNTPWVFENAFQLDEPVRYHHPQGAVIWVNLNEITLPLKQRNKLLSQLPKNLLP